MAVKKDTDPKSKLAVSRMEPVDLEKLRALDADAYKSMSFGTAALRVGEYIGDKADAAAGRGQKRHGSERKSKG